MQRGAMTERTDHFVNVGSLQELTAKTCPVVYVEGHAIAIATHQGQLYAIDNRCPHMGVPLDKGTIYPAESDPVALALSPGEQPGH